MNNVVTDVLELARSHQDGRVTSEVTSVTFTEDQEPQTEPDSGQNATDCDFTTTVSYATSEQKEELIKDTVVSNPDATKTQALTV